MTRLKERIKYWSQIFLLPVYGLSFLVPRNKKIWLFGSTFGRRFADNPRYFYLYLSQKKTDGIRPVWISHNRLVVELLNKNGYEAYCMPGLKAYWFCLRGKVYVYDNYVKDIFHWLSGGAVKINLWHGTGNKRANHDNIFDYYRNPRSLWERFTTFPRRITDEKPGHYTLATSKPLAVITKSAFASKDMEHVLIDGYPRNDAILDEDYPNLLNKSEQRNYNKVLQWKSMKYKLILYMPTFRDSEKDFFQVMKLEEFNRFLTEENAILVVKLHPKSKLKEEFEKIKYSNINNLEADNDPYTFMRYVDILITDYSSVYSDFMLLDRPAIAFRYDYDKYKTNTRDSYIPHEEYMPELTAYSMQDLMRQLKQAMKEDICKDARKKSRDRMFQYQDAGATARLTQKIEKLAGF